MDLDEVKNKKLERQQAYREKNREMLNTKAKAYYEAKKEEINAKRREKYSINKTVYDAWKGGFSHKIEVHFIYIYISIINKIEIEIDQLNFIKLLTMSDFDELTLKLITEFHNKEDYSYYIPIQTLCDIPVSCSIYIGKNMKIITGHTQTIYLKIKTSILIAPDDLQEDFDSIILYCKSCEIGLYLTELVVEELFKDLPNLVFDKYTGKFVLNKSSNTIFAFLKKNKNVKTSFQECCVCMEDTLTRTCCDHYCCYECMLKH